MSSPSTSAHRSAAAGGPPVRVAILTVSDTRTQETDKSGALIRARIEAAGHVVASYAILPDEPAQISAHVLALVEGGGVDAILTNGGTGIASRDGTYEAIAGLLEKTLPGFGEIFRMLSYHEVGAAAMLSRAVAGLRRGTLIFAMPGSTNAVTLAMDRLIVPELAHLVWEMRR